MLSLLQNISTRIEHEQRAIDARNYSSFAALAVLVLDHVLSCRSEYKYIWQAKFRLPQFLYLISRYWALSLQIIHYTFVQKYLIHGPVSSSLCKIWFSLLGSGCIMMGVCMNLILLLRLYALYMKDSKILALALPLIGQHVVALVVVGRAVFKDDAFSDTCDLYHTPIEALPLGILTIVSQAAVWLAAFKKRKIAQAAVLSLVVRESHWTLAVFGVLAAIMIPYSFATQSVNPFIIFVWPTTFISMTSCRLVLSMHKLKYSSARRESVTEFIFSTIINSTESSFHSALASRRSLPISTLATSPTESAYELSSWDNSSQHN